MYKAECLEYAKVSELPNIWDNSTPFHRAIALCELNTGRMDYVICGLDGGKPFTAKSFSTSIIHRIKEIYPYVLTDDSTVVKTPTVDMRYEDITTNTDHGFYGIAGINTIEQAQAWLRANGVSKGILSDNPHKLKIKVQEMLNNKTENNTYYEK